jgi:hypothetical protein
MYLRDKTESSRDDSALELLDGLSSVLRDGRGVRLACRENESRPPKRTRLNKTRRKPGSWESYLSSGDN